MWFYYTQFILEIMEEGQYHNFCSKNLNIVEIRHLEKNIVFISITAGCGHFKVQKIPPQQTQKMVLYIRHTCIVNLHDGKFIIMKNIHAM